MFWVCFCLRQHNGSSTTEPCDLPALLLPCYPMARYSMLRGTLLLLFLFLLLLLCCCIPDSFVPSQTRESIGHDRDTSVLATPSLSRSLSLSPNQNPNPTWPNDLVQLVRLIVSSAAPISTKQITTNQNYASTTRTYIHVHTYTHKYIYIYISREQRLQGRRRGPRRGCFLSFLGFVVDPRGLLPALRDGRRDSRQGRYGRRPALSDPGRERVRAGLQYLGLCHRKVPSPLRDGFGPRGEEIAPFRRGLLNHVAGVAKAVQLREVKDKGKARPAAEEFLDEAGAGAVAVRGG
mmetsp:Transcript_1118/g.2506  ORF Transcript_1118/g.2506 Transcript_1118/m.2506 type:complete len:292 (-) Transcript_1118:323-1198(-)